MAKKRTFSTTLRVLFVMYDIFFPFPDSHGVNLHAASSSTEVLVHIMGSSEVQSMLADKMVPKKAVWDLIAAEMKNIGFDMGERGGDRCRQKWAKAVRNYMHFARTRAFNMNACYPLYYDGVEAILNQKKRGKDTYAAEVKPLVNACVTADVFNERQDDECPEDAGGRSPSSPKQICQKDDSAHFSSSDIPLSSNSSEDDTSEVFETVAENCVLNSSAPADKNASKSASDRSNDEEIVLVFPGEMKQCSGSKFMCESEIPLGDIDSEACVTLYPDDVSDAILNNSLPKLINYPYAEDILFKCNEQSSHYSDSRKAMDVENMNLSLPDLLHGMTKPSPAPKPSGVSAHGSPTVVVSPKPNQPSRPIPTAGEAMMSLVRRLYDKEKRTEKGRVRRREARIHSLEVLLKEQSVRQQEMLNKAMLAIKQLE
jgi:hypothetical protein